jgi:hypothetical protein
MTWWLVTWSTYGSWLPGDPRGFQTWRGKEYIPPPKRYAKPGEKTYDSKKYATRFQSVNAMVPEPVKLTPGQRQCTVDAVVAEIAKLPLVPAALAVSSEHCHLLSKFGKLPIRPTVGVLKGEATKALHADGFDSERIWSDGSHMKSKNEGQEFEIALKYIVQHVNEGATVFIWPEFRQLANTR